MNPALPAVPGAYALIIGLGEPAGALAPGRYLYAGSAWGPGGIAARVRRHLRLAPAKTPRWHVDRLTAAGRIEHVVAVPGGRECGVFAAVAALPGVTVPAPGFGSSDCRVCPAHLLRIPDALDPETIARTLLAIGDGGHGLVQRHG